MLEFNYVYKIIELTTGREYIGRHKTDNFNDNYMGSGSDISSAYERNPANFIKTVLWMCRDQDEAIELEGALVDAQYIKQNYPSKTFNIIPGKSVDDYTKFYWIKKIYPTLEIGFIRPTGTGKIASAKNKYSKGGFNIKKHLNLNNAQRQKLQRELRKRGIDWTEFNSNKSNIKKAKEYVGI